MEAIQTIQYIDALFRERSEWLASKFGSVDEAFRVVRNDIQNERANRQTLVEGLNKLGEERLHGVELLIENYKTAHMAEHAAQKESMQEFKSNTEKRIEAAMAKVDEYKDDRGGYVLRESNDAQLKTLGDKVDRLEQAEREARIAAIAQLTQSLETKIQQLQESSDAKIVQNQDKITKIENAINVGNAKNQQSILALGILLTLVEIIIRFVSK